VGGLRVEGLVHSAARSGLVATQADAVARKRRERLAFATMRCVAACAASVFEP